MQCIASIFVQKKRKYSSIISRAIWRYPKMLLNWLDHIASTPESVVAIGELSFRLAGLRKKDKTVNGVKRILIVRLDEIGDLVLLSPFLRELRNNESTGQITLIVKPEVYNLVELCPYVDEVLTYQWGDVGKYRYLELHWRALKLAYRYLWQRRLDLAIAPRWDVDYYHALFLTYFSGASKRVGYSELVTDLKKRKNKGFDKLLTDVVCDKDTMHEVKRNLKLIEYMGGRVQENYLEIWISKSDEQFADDELRRQKVGPTETLVAFGPGGRAPKRRWPICNFVQLGSRLIKQDGIRIVVVGGRGEESLGHELSQALGEFVIDFTGRTTLRQAAAILKQCALFVGNDTGVMHLAAASGVAVVEISCHPLKGSPYHANSAERFGPWGVPHRVVQPENAVAPCTEACEAEAPHCILGVSVDSVVGCVNELINKDDVHLSNLNRISL